MRVVYLLKHVCKCCKMACENNFAKIILKINLKAAFQLSVFHTYVHARKCLNSSK